VVSSWCIRTTSAVVSSWCIWTTRHGTILMQSQKRSKRVHWNWWPQKSQTSAIRCINKSQIHMHGCQRTERFRLYRIKRYNEQWITYWQECGRKWLWPNLTHNPSICVNGTREQQDRRYNDKTTVYFKISIKDGKYQDSKWWYAYRDMLRMTTTTTCPHINIWMWSQLIGDYATRYWYCDMYVWAVLSNTDVCRTDCHYMLTKLVYLHSLSVRMMTPWQEIYHGVIRLNLMTLMAPCRSLLPSTPLADDHRLFPALELHSLNCAVCPNIWPLQG
jgi:hypothetical protein